MKRSSSHLTKEGSTALFAKKTKKAENSQNTQENIIKIIEKEPASILDNQHIIREIEKKEEKEGSYCFVIRLDPRVKRTSIVYTKLLDLNEKREEHGEKTLKITIRHDEANPRLITIRTKDRDDLALFIACLQEKEYFSADTGEQFLSLLTEKSSNSLSY